jgi:signal peptidase I
VTERGSDPPFSGAVVGQPPQPPVPVAAGQAPPGTGPQPAGPQPAGPQQGEAQQVEADRPGGRHVRQRNRNWQRFALEWLAVILVAVGVAVAVRAFVFQTFYIPSGSMEPTLMIGDRIIVDKLSYHLHAVGRGDIVVFATPPDEVAPPGVKDLVKRVIGLPGETISSADGQVWINGKPLSEPWLPRGVVTTGIRTQKIPAGYYFVMGDNRGDSEDSRVFGPISKSLIVGKVVFRIWPLSRIGFF